MIWIVLLITFVIIISIILLVVLPLTCVYDLYDLDRCSHTFNSDCLNGTIVQGKCICDYGYSGNPCKKIDGSVNIGSESSSDDTNIIGDTETQLRLKDMKYAYDAQPDAFRIVATWWIVYNQSDPIYSWWVSSWYLNMIKENTEKEIADEMEKIMDYFVAKKFGIILSGTFYQKYLKVISIKPSVWMDIISVNNLITTENAYTQLKWTFDTYRVKNENNSFPLDMSADMPKYSIWDFDTIYRATVSGIPEEDYVWMNRIFRKIIGGRPGYDSWPKYQSTPYFNDQAWKSFFSDASWKAVVGNKTRIDPVIIMKMESYLKTLCNFEWFYLRTLITDLYSCSTGKIKKLPEFTYLSF